MFESRTLNKFLYNLDDKLIFMEETIKEQDIEIKRLKKIESDYISKGVQESQNMMINTLSAILSTPELDPISATVIYKISNMGNVKDIHKYINKIIYKEGK